MTAADRAAARGGDPGVPEVGDGRTVDGGGVLRGSAGAALVGVALLLAGALFDVDAALHAWLTAYAAGLGVALGALALVMIGHVTGARWFVVVRRPAEAVAATLPLFVLLVIPLLVRLDVLYPWARDPAALPDALRAELARKEVWLDGTFFTVRSLGYLLVWSVLAWLLWRWSLRSDRRPGERVGRPVALSAAGLPLFGFTVTFASFDWLMSLQPTWHSTIFGVYVFAGGFLGALAVLVLLVRGFETRGLLRDRVAADHYYALGRLLLTFVVFWAYIAYSQGFLMWIADLPHEVEFYLTRWGSGWKWVLAVLAVGHFAIPFFALLSRSLKRRPVALSVVAAWLLAMHWIDVYWLVGPSLAGRGPWPGWEQGAAMLAVAGLMGAVGTWQLRGRSPVPVGDPHLQASMEYGSR